MSNIWLQDIEEVWLKHIGLASCLPYHSYLEAKAPTCETEQQAFQDEQDIDEPVNRSVINILSRGFKVGAATYKALTRARKPMALSHAARSSWIKTTKTLSLYRSLTVFEMITAITLARSWYLAGTAPSPLYVPLGRAYVCAATLLIFSMTTVRCGARADSMTTLLVNNVVWGGRVNFSTS